jgi:chitinase
MSSRIIGYYGEWSIYGHNFPVSSVNASQLTHLHYSFMLPNPAPAEYELQRANWAFPINPYNSALPEGTLTSHDEYAFSINLAALKALKRTNPNLKIIAAIGGWSGSAWLSKIFASPTTRLTFVSSVTKFLTENGFDGADIDWEFPNRQGIGFNIISPADPLNLGIVARELKQAFAPGGLSLSLAAGCEVTKLEDYSQAFPYLDYLGLMTYDISGDWTTSSGHQSPYYTNPKAPDPNSVEKTVAKVIQLGMPKDKIVVGSPIYGRGWNKCSPLNASAPIFGTCTGTVGLLDPSGSSGALDYRFLIKRLANGFTTYYDEIAQASYAYNAGTKELWTFDNPRAVLFKASKVRELGLGGMMFWDVSADAGLIDVAVKSLRAPAPTSAPTSSVPTTSPTVSTRVPTPSVPTTSPSVPTPRPTVAPSVPATCIKLFNYCGGGKPCCYGLKCLSGLCAVDPAIDPQCADPWAQCGGKDFSGPKCCKLGITCKTVSQWYSQCSP